MRILILLAASAMTLAASGPAFAQMAHDGMKTGAMAHMSAADMRRMNSCKAMSHGRMMRNANCRRMMRMHPDMMQQGATQGGGMMNHDAMKPSGH